MTSSTDIYYLQIENKKCYIVTDLGHFTLQRSLDSLTKELPSQEFFRIHRCVTVNLRHIESFTKTSVILDDGTVLPLSRYRYNDFLNAFSNYMSYQRK